METPIKGDESPDRVGLGDVTILVLSLLALLLVAAQELLALPAPVATLLRGSDHLLCAVFLADFGVRFWSAGNKWRFMAWGWIDLLSSIPYLTALRWGRLVRVVRLLILLRGLKSLRHLLAILFRRRMQGTVLAVLLVVGLLVLLASIGILICETPDPRANIKTAGDAVWWAFSTVTSVGYGDYYPVTLDGRLLAAILMTAGVGLFGTLTAAVAAWFLAGREDAFERRVLDELQALRRHAERQEHPDRHGETRRPE